MWVTSCGIFPIIVRFTDSAGIHDKSVHGPQDSHPEIQTNQASQNSPETLEAITASTEPQGPPAKSSEEKNAFKELSKIPPTRRKQSQGKLERIQRAKEIKQDRQKIKQELKRLQEESKRLEKEEKLLRKGRASGSPSSGLPSSSGGNMFQGVRKLFGGKSRTWAEHLPSTIARKTAFIPPFSWVSFPDFETFLSAR